MHIECMVMHDVQNESLVFLYQLGTLSPLPSGEKEVSQTPHYIIPRPDYCNSLYYELPAYQLKKLQLVFNRAARLIVGTAPRERITPVLIDLHWLPIKARIMFKICVLTYRILH